MRDLFDMFLLAGLAVLLVGLLIMQLHDEFTGGKKDGRDNRKS